MTPWIDIGCEDFEKATQNREMVAKDMFTTAYAEIENAVRGTPQKASLPSWITPGKLPVVSRKDWQQYGGEQAGMHETYEGLWWELEEAFGGGLDRV